jgi:hypothetical protein
MRLVAPKTAKFLLIGLAMLAQAAAAQVVNLLPRRPTNGSPILFSIAAPRNVQAISGLWLGHTVDFFRVRGGAWYALAGVPLETPAGIYTLRMTELYGNGRSTLLERHIRVFRAKYPRITIKVAKQFTEPNPAQVATISADKDVKQKTLAEVSPERLWSGRFTAPVSAPVSDLFGTARVFNQEVRSRHQGVDYAVPSGTPVHAVNRGIVLLARPMFFEGNFVVIDHGQGLLSLYLHLSEFKVKEGEQVSTGQVIGLSGGTGRATGAHLHLAIRWQGVYLDPAKLLSLAIPPA